MIRKLLPSKPRPLLLWDSLGALVTSAVTGCVLATELVPTGLPTTVLIALAAIVIGYFATSLFGYLQSANPASVLKVMAIANLSYGCATMVLCSMYSKSLTTWGWIYFPLEFVILVALSMWEWKVSQYKVG